MSNCENTICSDQKFTKAQYIVLKLKGQGERKPCKKNCQQINLYRTMRWLTFQMKPII